MKSTKREMADKIRECSARVGISKQQVKVKLRSRGIHGHEYIHKAKFSRGVAFKNFISWRFESRFPCNLTEISGNNGSA